MIKLPDETEMKWRDLALQFDGHRMQAIGFLKMILNSFPDSEFQQAREFLKEGPRPGDEVLRNYIYAIAEIQRLKGLNATAQPVSDGCKVPNEPTPEMQTAGATAIRFDTTPVNKLFTANAVYRAMLAAAPGGQDDET